MRLRLAADMRWRWRAAVVATALAGALVPLPPTLVERLYSTRVYSALQPLITSASNRVPIALLDPNSSGTKAPNLTRGHHCQKSLPPLLRMTLNSR